MTRRVSREVAEVVRGEVVEHGRARPVERYEEQPRVVYVQAPPPEPPVSVPVVAPEPRPSRVPEFMAGFAAVLAAIGVLVWALNPHFFEPREPLSGPQGQHQVSKHKEGLR